MNKDLSFLEERPFWSASLKLQITAVEPGEVSQDEYE